MRKLAFTVSALGLILIMGVHISCEPLDEETLDSLKYALGWTEEDENTENIEDDINLSTQFGSGNLPSKVDLFENFPSIGNQGQYGTCVAWACGYNLRSFLYAKSKGLTTSQLNDNNTFSPKDLFWAIANADKGEDCNGTNFETALDVMVSRGIATMGTVPYTSLGNCSSSPQSSWTSNANQFKIESYREIELKKDVIKKYLSEGRAVVFGAKLGDQFMDADGSSVLSYQDFNYTGQHAYHAMILSGYDDSKGPNGAFRVVNSWGTSWGDNGFLWVDQNYFVTSNFGFCAFVGYNQGTEPDNNNDNVVDNVTSGSDVVAWELTDADYKNASDADASDPRWRTANYNVYNSGESTINASQDWNILYIYYNAYDANDYGIILYDSYSDDYGTQGGNGELPALTDVPAQGYWWNWVDVPSGKSVSEMVFGSTDPFEWTYRMPVITGDYYLVIIADGFDVISEFDEDNNYYFFAQPNGDPISISGGVIQSAVKSVSATNKSKGIVPYKGMPSDFQTVRTKTNVNAYSTKEIATMLKVHSNNGELQNKVKQYMAKQTSVKPRKQK